MRVDALPFADLEPEIAYEVWRLRQQVFVVEQDCAYLDLDGRDLEPATRHLLLTDGRSQGEDLLGYLRLLSDPGEWRIGRVLLRPDARGRGLADRLVVQALDDAEASDPSRDVVLDAQAPLAGWYEGFGFTVDGPEFVEDGILHAPMRLPAPMRRPGSDVGADR